LPFYFAAFICCSFCPFFRSLEGDHLRTVGRDLERNTERNPLQANLVAALFGAAQEVCGRYNPTNGISDS
jgi:hypothetical protein